MSFMISFICTHTYVTVTKNERIVLVDRQEYVSTTMSLILILEGIRRCLGSK
jgi:hypothetical protein